MLLLELLQEPLLLLDAVGLALFDRDALVGVTFVHQLALVLLGGWGTVLADGSVRRLVHGLERRTGDTGLEQ